MKIVGDKLRELALVNRGGVEFDLLGRSAFNRYYYAAYLEVRKMLSLLDDKWAKVGHSKIPEIVKNSLKTRVQQHLKKTSVSKALTKSEKSTVLGNITRHGGQLSELMDNAYYVRVIADYKPDTKVTCEGSVIMLDTCKLDTARNWQKRVEVLCKDILRDLESVGYE